MLRLDLLVLIPFSEFDSRLNGFLSAKCESVQTHRKKLTTKSFPGKASGATGQCASAPLLMSQPRRLLGCGFGSFCLRLDRLGFAALALDFDAASFCFFSLRKYDAQHSVAIVG